MSRLVISIACNEQEADSIRKFAQKYFRQLHLRYKTERTYPESGWNTPAFGEAIWVPNEAWVASSALWRGSLRKLAAERPTSPKAGAACGSEAAAAPASRIVAAVSAVSFITCR